MGLRNVRLAALDLREISGLDLEGSGWILGFRDSRVSPKFHVFLTFCLNVTFLCKLRRINVDVALSTSIA